MKQVTCWDDLVPLGIVCLTGEARGSGYRIPLDLTERVRAVAKCLDPPDVRLAEAWHCGNVSDPDVGTFMLAHEMLVPIGAFALLESGCRKVWHYADGSLLGVEPSGLPGHVEAAGKVGAPEMTRRYSNLGTAGARHIHLMSGRAP